MRLHQIADCLSDDEYEVLRSIPGVSKIDPRTKCYLRKNGNYHILFLEDGSKIIFGTGNSMEPVMPECIDCSITTVCDNGCEYCYMNCSRDGQHANLRSYEYIYDLILELPPYTELAINLNDLSHPELYQFLKFLKERKIFVNGTINQNHFENPEIFHKLIELKDEGLIRGIGVSFTHRSVELRRRIRHIERVYGKCIVVHVIAGVITEEEWDNLGSDLNILILGYKEIGRGIDYADTRSEEINDKIAMLSLKIRDIVNKTTTSKFRSISFDGLAIDQLMIKDIVSEEQFDNLYAGDEGAYTFYLDLVNMKYSISSITDEMYECDGKSIKEMFDSVRVPGLKNE